MPNISNHDPPDTRNGSAETPEVGLTEQPGQPGLSEGARPGRKVFRMKGTGRVSGLPLLLSPPALNIFAAPKPTQRMDRHQIRRSLRNTSRLSSRHSASNLAVDRISARDLPVAPSSDPRPIPDKFPTHDGYPKLASVRKFSNGVNIFTPRETRSKAATALANIFATRARKFEPRRSPRTNSLTVSKSSAQAMDTYSGEGLPAARSDVGIVMATAARRYDEWISKSLLTPCCP